MLGTPIRTLLRTTSLATALLAICAGAGLGLPASAELAAEARAILGDTGVEGGIIVHLGCGDGRLTAALRANDRYTVHGLDPDATQIKVAREQIQRLGLYGPVSVERLAGPALPYADNLINLVVVERQGAVPDEEILRVLAPRGIACLRQGDRWIRRAKPRPANIDEWSHFLHDAGNNPVARDAVGPPESLRWVAPPLWLRSHETPSGIEGLVTSGGRLFYFFDEGLIGITDQRLPERWSLVCRDAFNGKLLWKRPVDGWGWPEWASGRFEGQDWTEITGGRTVVPDENQRRLVAEGERVYATLGYQAPLSILSAATGEALAVVEETAPVRQIIAADGIAIALSREFGSGAAKRRGAEGAPATALFAVEGDTGHVLWKKDTGQIRGVALACDQGRVVYQDGAALVCLSQQTGGTLWEVEPAEKKSKALVAHDGVVVIRGTKALEARDGATGELLWHKQVLAGTSFEAQDVFVVDGVIWPGMASVTESGEQTGKSAHVVAVGYDLRTGEERKRISVQNLRSPEHHHRCYRNKATSRYLISAMEGMEFLDLRGDGHAQHNWLRGACKLGIMPANGLLYVPADQCFCEPGAKLLGFAAVSSEPPSPAQVVPDEQRLEKGGAFGSVGGTEVTFGPGDWLTYRHDAARHGSTPTSVPAQVAPAWRVKLGGGLTQPVAAGGRAYVASRDAHTVHALDMETGKRAWSFVAGARVDSPPTLYRGLLLFGSADGYVYCLRAADGALAWRFLAAPYDRRIAYFDQIESAWPVHGSVLVREPSSGLERAVVYFAAGRSTYLDGGIRLYGLDPFTGKVLYTTTLEGPLPDLPTDRDVSFYVLGANAEILVSEGDALYMRQKKLTPALEEVSPPVLSTKGEMDIGLHIFSTSGLLDGSWYNRTFWMYSKRWPGFQLANQAPKSGQLLVVDEDNTYGIKVFYRRNVHSSMFFPGKEGYLLFADRNTTEPQIVGEEGAKTPVAWLPQSDYARRKGVRTLDSPAFGLDKMIGYTRAEAPVWTQWLPVRVRAMVKAGDVLFAAGPPDVFDAEDPYAAFEGRRGARLVALSAKDGTQLAETQLEVPPVFDGLIAAGGRLLVSLEDGSLACLGG